MFIANDINIMPIAICLRPIPNAMAPPAAILNACAKATIILAGVRPRSNVVNIDTPVNAIFKPLIFLERLAKTLSTLSACSAKANRKFLTLYKLFIRCSIPLNNAETKPIIATITGNTSKVPKPKAANAAPNNAKDPASFLIFSLASSKSSDKNVRKSLPFSAIPLFFTDCINELKSVMILCIALDILSIATLNSIADIANKSIPGAINAIAILKIINPAANKATFPKFVPPVMASLNLMNPFTKLSMSEDEKTFKACAAINNAPEIPIIAAVPIAT